ncbi:MAG: MbnP family copper-binding protein [Acidobacteriota bacterium]
MFATRMRTDRPRRRARPLVVAVLAAAAAVLIGCGPPAPEPLTIQFDARVGDAPARCGVRYDGVGTAGAPVELADARFYVSEIALTRADGSAVPLVLDADTPWQHENVALLDFEDATGRCGDTGTAQTNGAVRATAPPGDYDGLRFTIGVPRALNHLDGPTAPSPLNLNALYWNWRFGYIFTKVEFWNPDVVSAGSVDPVDTAAAAPDAAAPDAAAQAGDPTGAADGTAAEMPVIAEPGPTITYLVHIGSTGCASSAPTTPPDAPCARPSRVTIALDGFDPRTDVVRLDLAGLVDGIDVTQSVPRPPGCMSAPIDPDCGPVFANLGLDPDTGACADDCRAQKLASRAPAEAEP